jgi:hypothetical protein
MHNPHMIVALGVYIGVLFVGMAIGMPITFSTTQKISADAKQSRVNATIAGGVAGFVITLVYAWMLRNKAKTATYWASLSILFFGLWYAVYMIVPKTYDTPSSAKTPATQNAVIGAHSAALGLAIVAYALSWKFMKSM